MFIYHDSLSADKINNSRFSELRTVRCKLYRYFPLIFHKHMSIDELLDSRFKFKENNYSNIFNQLHILNKIRSGLKKLYLEPNEYKSFDVR